MTTLSANKCFLMSRLNIPGCGFVLLSNLGLLFFDGNADWLLKSPKEVELGVHEQPSDSFHWRDDIQARWKATGSALIIFSFYNFLQQMITQSVSHMFLYLRNSSSLCCHHDIWRVCCQIFSCWLVTHLCTEVFNTTGGCQDHNIYHTGYSMYSNPQYGTSLCANIVDQCQAAPYSIYKYH